MFPVKFSTANPRRRKRQAIEANKERQTPQRIIRRARSRQTQTTTGANRGAKCGDSDRYQPIPTLISRRRSRAGDDGENSVNQSIRAEKKHQNSQRRRRINERQQAENYGNHTAQGEQPLITS